MAYSIQYIKNRSPKCFLLENTYSLGSFKKYRPLITAMIDQLSTAGPHGYLIKLQIINSKSYVPQNRPRLYMVGIRKDRLRTGVQLRKVPMFPPLPVRPRFQLRHVVIPLPNDTFRMLPELKAARANVETAYKKVAGAGTIGINPFRTPVVVDMYASPSFSGMQIEASPCLTRSRASQKGYWCSTKGGPLSLTEMAQLQGFDPNWVAMLKDELRLSDTKIGGIVGNAQTITVVADLVPHLLYHAQIINYRQFVTMKKNASTMHDYYHA